MTRNVAAAAQPSAAVARVAAACTACAAASAGGGTRHWAALSSEIAMRERRLCDHRGSASWRGAQRDGPQAASALH